MSESVIAFLHALSRWLNQLTGGPVHMSFSAYSFDLMVNNEGWAAWWGTWRITVIDAFCERLTGREFHCLDAWLRDWEPGAWD